MKRFFLEIQIGFLVIVGVALVLATGYLAYTGMNSILDSVAKESKPDVKLNLIQILATDLEKAESSIRLYAYTRSDKDLQPYYQLVTGIDQQLEQLAEAGKSEEDFSKSLDTISYLVEQKIVIWNEMLPLYKVQQVERYLDTISRELEQKIESDSIREGRNIFQKIFKKQDKVELDEEKIVQDIENVKEADSLRQANIRNKEQRLAVANSRLTRQFYGLVKRMEEAELQKRRKKAVRADQMADEVYQWIGWFSLSSVIALILVILVITRYVRKSHKYQLALVKAKNEAENLARAKEMFVANVSHELRTPMNVISGFVEQLLKRPQDKENDETLRIIKSSSDHLVRIVNDILDFSKLDSGKMILEPVHFKTHTVSEEILLLFKQSIAERQIELKVNVDEHVPEVLYGDSIRLKQILINLVGNAIKFTGEGVVEVKIEAENQLAGHLDLKIAVHDTGIGIAPDKLEMIFEDFTQAESGTTQKFGGTGLGLSIVNKLVDLHHGHIDVNSKLNEGTTFSCRLPYKKGSAELIEEIQVQQSVIPEEIKKLKILVVDDELYNRKLVASILRKWEISYEEAEDGLQAVNAFESHHFDLVLMDNRMPGMDGLEASEQIRQKFEANTNKLSIVFFSAASATEDQKKKHKKAGINAYLPKPFAEEELLKLLHDFKKLERVYQKQEIEEIPVKGNPPVDEAPVGSQIDLTQLYRVAGDDKVFVMEMLEKFIESFEAGYERLNAGLAENDFLEVGNAAHKLASPCRHLGADLLLAILKEIEQGAEIQAPMENLKELAVSVGKEYEQVKNQILKHLSETKK